MNVRVFKAEWEFPPQVCVLGGWLSFRQIVGGWMNQQAGAGWVGWGGQRVAAASSVSELAE